MLLYYFSSPLFVDSHRCGSLGASVAALLTRILRTNSELLSSANDTATPGEDQSQVAALAEELRTDPSLPLVSPHTMYHVYY